MNMADLYPTSHFRHDALSALFSNEALLTMDPADDDVPDDNAVSAIKALKDTHARALSRIKTYLSSRQTDGRQDGLRLNKTDGTIVIPDDGKTKSFQLGT